MIFILLLVIAFLLIKLYKPEWINSVIDSPSNTNKESNQKPSFGMKSNNNIIDSVNGGNNIKKIKSSGEYLFSCGKLLLIALIIELLGFAIYMSISSGKSVGKRDIDTANGILTLFSIASFVLFVIFIFQFIKAGKYLRDVNKNEVNND